MSTQMIVILGCIVVLFLLVLVFIIAFMQGREINYENRLDDFNEEEIEFLDLNKRMAGDATTDAPLPTSKSKKKR